MGRKLLGYRGRARHNDEFVYATSTYGFCWFNHPPSPQDRHTCAFETRRAHEEPVDMDGNPIEVSDVKIVAVYLKTNEYEASLASRRFLEDLSDFDRAVVEEIDRRGIDAIVEPADFGGMPTTLRFRAPNGGFVWIPILAFSVVDGPKETRAGRTVDRMLAAIEDVAKNLSGIDTGK